LSKVIIHSSVKKQAMKKTAFILSFILANCVLNAQVVYDYLKAADNYYKKGDYNSAAEYYEKYLGQKKGTIRSNRGEYDPYSVQSKGSGKKEQVAVSNWEHAVYNTAESYRMLHYPAKSEPYYKEVVAFDSTHTQFPLAAYWQAQALRALEKYDEAEQAMKGFLQSYTGNDIYATSGKKELQNLQFIQVQLKKKDLNLYTVNKAGGKVNGTGGTAAPVWVNSNTLFFTSARPDDDNSKSKTYVNKVYQASFSEGVPGEVTKVTIPTTGSIHQGIVSVTPDGNTMFLTRWEIKDGKKSSALYSSTNNNGTWSEPAKLDSLINLPGANTQQPFVMPDGKNLLFASDRPGSVGGFDLWYAPLNGGQVGAPQNLGNAINTKEDEQAPFYHAASGTLVFSSNGRVGMGGYDFFASKGSIGNWAQPENLGAPLNSVKDDIYFTSKGPAKNMLADVYFSSDRASACCLELFTLSKVRPLKQISGTVVSCETNQPLPGASIVIVNDANQTVFNKTVGDDGSYAFTLEDFQSLKATASANGYIEKTTAFAGVSNDEEIMQKNPAICLVKPEPPPPPVDTVVVMNNIYYEFDKATLKPESYPGLDEVVAMLNKYPTMVIELGGHTDDAGSDAYNQRLSEARAKSCVDYLVSKGIDRSRLEAKGYGESKPIAPNKKENGKPDEEGRQKNRRTEFKVLHY